MRIIFYERSNGLIKVQAGIKFIWHILCCYISYMDFLFHYNFFLILYTHCFCQGLLWSPLFLTLVIILLYITFDLPKIYYISRWGFYEQASQFCWKSILCPGSISTSNVSDASKTLQYRVKFLSALFNSLSTRICGMKSIQMHFSKTMHRIILNYQ